MGGVLCVVSTILAVLLSASAYADTVSLSCTFNTNSLAGWQAAAIPVAGYQNPGGSGKVNNNTGTLFNSLENPLGGISFYVPAVFASSSSQGNAPRISTTTADVANGFYAFKYSINDITPGTITGGSLSFSGIADDFVTAIFLNGESVYSNSLKNGDIPSAAISKNIDFVNNISIQNVIDIIFVVQNTGGPGITINPVSLQLSGTLLLSIEPESQQLLQPYTPYTRHIDPMKLPLDETDGKFYAGIRRNPDVFNPFLIKEDDLIRLDVTPEYGGVVKLEHSDNLTLYTWFESGWYESYFRVFNAKEELVTSDLTLYVSYNDAGDDCGYVSAFSLENEQTVEFDPFNDIVIAFVGEFQTAGVVVENGEPVRPNYLASGPASQDGDIRGYSRAFEIADDSGNFYAPQAPKIGDWEGINKIAIDLLKAGYDVHVFDEGGRVAWGTDINPNKKGGDIENEDADTDGSGLSYDTLVHAIKYRGQTNLAFFGYSHGAGQVYNITKRLAENAVEDDTIGRYAVCFTGYIDAVDNTGNALTGSANDGNAERRRPIDSLYHWNRFQWNSLLPGTHGGNTHSAGFPKLTDNLDISTHYGVELWHSEGSGGNGTTSKGTRLQDFAIDNFPAVILSLEKALYCCLAPEQILANKKQVEDTPPAPRSFQAEAFADGNTVLSWIHAKNAIRYKIIAAGEQYTEEYEAYDNVIAIETDARVAMYYITAVSRFGLESEEARTAAPILPPADLWGSEEEDDFWGGDWWW